MINHDARFKNYISINSDTDCHEWTGPTKYGYGIFYYDGKAVKAHRYSYEYNKGAIPDGLCVCHSCDNRKCINPQHLWLGTRRDNNKDRDLKNRYNIINMIKSVTGENNKNAKLTELDILNIRDRHKNGESCYAIAKSYPVSRRTINKIVNRKAWRAVK